jgi:hypothetical protein
MNSATIACPKCRVSLNAEDYHLGFYNECANCGADLQMETFPAFYRPVTPGQTGETILIEGEAGCFYHPTKKAVIPCEACGRFLCALCDIDLNGEHYCPNCVESGRRKGKFTSLENQRFLYDELALTLAIMGVLVCGLTGPVALYYAIWHWKSPRSITTRTRITSVAAIIIALAQIGLMIMMIIGAILE